MRDRPRGIRNDNPGNIERTNDTWMGMSYDQSGDSRFVVFSAPVYGLRALMIVLRNYQKLYDLNTIEQIVTRWAPPHENPTDKYIWHVSTKMGVASTAPIDLDDRETLVRLTKAMVRHENGTPPDDRKDWYDEDLYGRAADLVFGKT